MKLVTSAAFVALVSILGACGGSEGGSSSADLTIDGVPADVSDSSGGVDAEGNIVLVIAGDNYSFSARMKGAATGTFSSSAASGAVVEYSDGTTTFIASDTATGSSYTVTITAFSASTLEGTITATFVDESGVTRSNPTTPNINANFALALGRGNGSNPYGTKYFGVFRVEGQMRTGTDMAGNPIWGPKRVAAIRVTLDMTLLGKAAGIAAFTISKATVSDSKFGCLGCAPAQGSVLTLPEKPGTPLPNGASMSGHGMSLQLAGAMILTANAPGELYTSTDGRMIGNALGIDQSWTALLPGNVDYFQGAVGDAYFNLNPATRKMSWALTRSSL